MGHPNGPLKMEPIGCHIMSVRNYHYSLYNNTAGHRSQLLCGGSLKSHAFFLRHYRHNHSTMHTGMFEYIEVHLPMEDSLELW
jgi:hypothetical protein